MPGQVQIHNENTHDIVAKDECLFENGSTASFGLSMKFGLLRSGKDTLSIGDEAQRGRVDVR